LTGRPQEARFALTELLGRAQNGDARSYDIATIHIALGEEEPALTWLERAVAEYTQAFFTVDPMFGPIRGHPRFQSMRERFGLPAVNSGGPGDT
jgi:hypothetical protein